MMFTTRFGPVGTLTTAGAWLSLVLVVAATTLSGCNGNRSRADRAAQLYYRSCSGCHGPRGEGLTRPGFKVPPAALKEPSVYQRLSDADLRQVIRNGKGQMPAFGRLLPDDDLELIIEHLHRMSGTSGATPATQSSNTAAKP